MISEDVGKTKKIKNIEQRELYLLVEGDVNSSAVASGKSNIRSTWKHEAVRPTATSVKKLLLGMMSQYEYHLLESRFTVCSTRDKWRITQARPKQF
jgi:hypothetical protein